MSDRVLYAGIAGARLSSETYDLGYGVDLRRTYACVFAHFMMAFEEPEPGKHHPGPWRACRDGGLQFDVAVELRVPREPPRPDWFDEFNTVWWLTCLLRLRCAHSVTVPVVADSQFQDGKHREDIRIWIMEADRYRRQARINPSILLETELSWVREYWVSGGMLARDLSFNMLIQAFDQCLFAGNEGLAILAIWGALESIFSPSHAELRFRVSANIAAFLEPRGEPRQLLQKQVAKLYDARSMAAHGADAIPENALRDTYNLARRIIIKIIEDDHVPKRDDLDRLLFN